MEPLPAGTGVVAFVGTAKLIAASTNPGAAIRGVLVRLIRQFSQSGGRGKAIVFKIGIRGDVRNGAGNGLSQGAGSGLASLSCPFTESRSRQIHLRTLRDRNVVACGQDKRLVGATPDAYLANMRQSRLT